MVPQGEIFNVHYMNLHSKIVLYSAVTDAPSGEEQRRNTHGSLVDSSPQCG